MSGVETQWGKCMNVHSIVAVVLLVTVLAGCDKMQQQGPIPTYRSSALEAVSPTPAFEAAAPVASAPAAASVPAAKP